MNGKGYSGSGPGGSGTTDNTTDTRIPFKDGSTFEDSPLYVDTANEKVVSDWTFEVPGSTINVGPVTSVSAGTGELIIKDEITGDLKYVISSKFDASGALVPTYLALEPEVLAEIQPDFSESITANPLTWFITGSVALPKVRQANTSIFKAGSPMTNVRGKFSDRITGEVLRYVPSKAMYDAFENGDPSAVGLSLITGNNKLDFISTEPGTPGVFNLGVQPFLVRNGQIIDIEIKADSVDILGLSSIPYQAVDVQDGAYLDIITADENGNITTPGDVHIKGNAEVDGTITSSSTQNLLVTDNHILLNNGYQTEVAKIGGIEHVYLPTSTKDSVVDTEFIPGVAAVSNPTVETVGSGTFAEKDIIMFNATSENDGLFEVLSHIGNTLIVKGIGTVVTVTGLVRDQFIANPSDSGTITKVNIASICADENGDWGVSKGSDTDEIAFKHLAVQDSFGSVPATRSLYSPLFYVGEAGSKGDLYIIAGFNLGSGLPQILKSDLAIADRRPAIGVLQEDAIIGDQVRLLVYGEMEGIFTIGSFSGTLMYLGDDGAFRTITPSNYVQSVGSVLIEGSVLTGRVLFNCTTQTSLFIDETLVDMGGRSVEGAL